MTLSSALKGTQLRAYARGSVRSLGRVGGHVVASRWAPYSRLFLVSDSAQWSISRDVQELSTIAGKLGARVAGRLWLDGADRQSVFYGSQFILREQDWLSGSHRLGLAYFHGRPGSGIPAFDSLYERLRLLHPRLERIQVSHSEMRDLVLETGIAPEKLFLIPIGINLSYFSSPSAESRQRIRSRLGIPESAVVIGSFQKDGVGWGAGMEPKFIKGPDIFLKVVEMLRPRVPELYVLLSGPGRGYVAAGLTRIGVPYRHEYLHDYPQIGELYQALDVYLVTSRQEGGPKGVLESMASGVPLVTTRVGQAMDLVRHTKNGFMVDVDDAEALVYWTEHAITHRSQLDCVVQEGRCTAEANSYEAQIPLWRRFFADFVELPAPE